MIPVVAKVVRPLWKTVAIVILFILGFIAWFVGVVFFGITTVFAVIGRTLEHTDPSIAKWGNCWTFALPRFYSHGGYLLIRAADKIRFLWFLKVPHVAWVKVLPKQGLVIESFDPVARKKAFVFPWFVIWYHGRIKRVEADHPIDELFEDVGGTDWPPLYGENSLSRWPPLLDDDAPPP